jgi:acyl transferase domain-containing protein/acyl carrier protein/nucleoside-diphosphate-sugar epimerase/SAM-dependent methyltransferase
MTQELSSHGLKTVTLPLLGRYHHPSNSEVARKLINLARSRIELQFPDASKLHTPPRPDVYYGVNSQESILHELAIRSLLTTQLNWQARITVALSQSKDEGRESLSMTVFGLTNCLPRTINEWQVVGKKLQLSEEVHHLRLRLLPLPPELSGSEPSTQSTPPKLNPEGGIAIVGMACRFPGADSLDDFWSLVKEGSSMLSEVPANRFKVNQLRRSSSKSRFWGNFLSDPDAFDRQFFKISSREATSMDPQQRLLLQVAYEAMQSSQYFDGNENPRDFGCYVGVGSVDYQDNIYSHQPTAYSAVGSLRAFLSGRISHYFGWTGPSITYDTACSSSLVALHSACKALLSGECNGALAGGVNVITSPALYQDLGAASFLSPTGASNAFDAKADGYCRGEGCGLVVLKRLSDAIDAGDPILSVIAGSAINQSDNSVSITVPHSESQSSLYRKVLSQSGLKPSDVSYVEAHGTGTPVGDPIEFQSIRNVFGDPERSTTLHIGSVKANIGHLEAASGVAALIKSVLMIQKKAITKQPNFTSLNPRIPLLEPDHMAVTTKTFHWESNFRAICINNYGASGTNGALIVCEPPAQHMELAVRPQSSPSFSEHLISVCANSPSSLQAYCSSLRNHALSTGKAELRDYAFNIAHQQDYDLKYRRSAIVESMDEFHSLLTPWKEGENKLIEQTQDVPRPIVLCFGGQSSRIIGLDKTLYDSVALFRFHLDTVCETLREINGMSIFPHIFSRDPIENEVTLNCSLFALQYASVMCWVDSGVVVDTVIGHSFGQITALCIAGVLSLKDGLIYVSGRASLFERKWNEEKGAMIAVRTDSDAVLRLINEIPEELEIACYNSPTDIVLSGSRTGIEALEIAATGAGIQAQRLNTNRAFHSRFMNEALPELAQLASRLSFNCPKIRIETCTEGESWPSFNPGRLLAHSRQPVYFKDAVQRIQQRLGSCVWLEAGSKSLVTKLTSKCIHDSYGSVSDHIFLPVDLSAGKSENSLIQTTAKFHDAGYHTNYWLYHRRQRHDFKHINLPPYQFDKSRYWLDYKDFPDSSDSKEADDMTDRNSGILRFLGNRDTAQNSVAAFVVNVGCASFQAAVSGHAVMGNGLCPASLYIELAAQAACHLHQVETVSLPQVKDLRILAPLTLDTTRTVEYTLTQPHSARSSWSFALISHGGNRETNHASGTIRLRPDDDHDLHTRRDTLERFVGIDRCNALLEDKLADAMQGSLVYKVFDRVVNYKHYYQAVQHISSNGSETAGMVTMPDSSGQILADETICAPLIIDNFLQVAGIHVNCLRDTPKDELYICTYVDEMQLFETMMPEKEEQRSWAVYVYTKAHGEKALESNILAFNKNTGSLCMALQGVTFSRVNISSLARSLRAANPKSAEVVTALESYQPKVNQAAIRGKTEKVRLERPKPARLQLQHTQETPEFSIIQVKGTLSSITDVPIEQINDSDTLDALGIDSLMTTELVSEIKKVFHVDISPNDTDLHSTVSELANRLLSRSAPSTYYSIESTPTDLDFVDVNAFLSNIVDIPAEEINEESTMDELGIDSLMEMEVLSEIQTAFGVNIPATQFRQLSVASLSDLLQSDRNMGMSSSVNSLNSVSTDGTVASTSYSIISGTVASMKNGSPRFRDENETAIPHGSMTVDSVDDIHKVFAAIKDDFDGFAAKTQLGGFYSNVYHLQLQLVTSYIIDAFDNMGCSLASMPEGVIVPLIPHGPRHEKLVRQLYSILETAGVISRVDYDGYKRTRRSINIRSSSQQLLENLLNNFPHHSEEHKLLSITGPHLADCLRGTTDAINLIFGSRESKELLSSVYLNAPMFATGTKLLCKYLVKLAPSLSRKISPSRAIHILEIGAGTGGTTKNVISTLASSKIPFEYTFSDISASLVAAAKKTFSSCEQMSFMALDIEKGPIPELVSKYDLVISTNCIHATKDLKVTTANIRKLLNNTGILCLIELTRNLFWFDLVFGLLEGWWLFNDGRNHALASETFWGKSLSNAGYGHVDWTESESKESELLRLIIAYNQAIPVPSSQMSMGNVQADLALKSHAPLNGEALGNGRQGSVILLTGATGNLGSHLLQSFLSREGVSQVICLNRLTRQDHIARQSDALKNRGIQIPPDWWSSRLQVFETKTESRRLGLELDEYQYLCNNVTHIVHNAWPMSFRRPLTSFEPQFTAMKNLLQLTRDIRNVQQAKKQASSPPRLLFISSIGVVGHHPVIQKYEAVPEAPVPSDGSATLDMGYTKAKLRCEHMIQNAASSDDFSDTIEACFARIGQMTGSREHGIWNPDEHFPALLKASQSIGALPKLEGVRSTNGPFSA